jgi:ABC-type bacteriocin/lantibiotic exporter with double-glycine peptidase domain
MRQRGKITAIITISLAGLFTVALLTRNGSHSDHERINAVGREHDAARDNPAVLQDRTNNCGAAALKMVLDHFGCVVSLRDLESRLVSSGRGTSFQRLKEVAGEFGVQAEGWKLCQADLARVQYPIILCLRKKHFVVADSLSMSRVLSVRDPATGRVRISLETLADIWGGDALLFSSKQIGNSKTIVITEKE